jgi:hypothetical protein
MVKQGVNKIRVLAVAGLVAVSFASAPAKAHHDHGIVAPMAALIVLGAMVHHSNHGNHGNYRRYDNHYRPHHNHNHHRRHSDSHGGYHNPKRNHHKRW